MAAALGWGALAASSLVVGALLGLARDSPWARSRTTSPPARSSAGRGRRGAGVGLLAAIFVSNLPEAIGSASAMHATGTRPGAIRRLWLLIALGCTLATVAGYALADVTGGDLQAAIDGFAAGALLVMLIDSMIPEAVTKSGRLAGLVTALGFAVAAGLSSIS
jgi:zinc transporter, ZIP family